MKRIAFIVASCTCALNTALSNTQAPGDMSTIKGSPKAAACSPNGNDRGGYVEADAKAVAAELKARLSTKAGK